MRVSIKDIATALGVSASTVSMALHDHHGISDETKAKVVAKAAELGYTKHLKTNEPSPEFIQLVIYKKHGNVVADTPFFSQLTQGIEYQTKKKGHNLLITYFYENQDVQEQLRSILSSNCSGILLLATEMMDGDLEHFENLNIPMVILDSYFPNRPFDCIGINNVQGACAAVEHLVEQGHRKIGYLSSKVGIRNFYERMDGYKKGLRLSGETNKPDENIYKITPVAEEALKDMNAYLRDKPEIPTAFYADNDIIATSCMRALKAHGYRIPEDISIIGFDDTPMCDLVDPPLTTMHVKKNSLGVLAVNRLLERMNGDVDENIRIEVATELVERKSVKKI